MTLLDDNFDDEKSNNYDKTGHQISLLCTVHCTQVLCYVITMMMMTMSMMMIITARYLLCTAHCTRILCDNDGDDDNINDENDDYDYDGQVPFVHSHK